MSVNESIRNLGLNRVFCFQFDYKLILQQECPTTNAFATDLKWFFWFQSVLPEWSGTVLFLVAIIAAAFYSSILSFALAYPSPWFVLYYCHLKRFFWFQSVLPEWSRTVLFLVAIIAALLVDLPQLAKCYCFLRQISSVLPVAQKVVVRLERQVATVYAYFCAAVVLPCAVVLTAFQRLPLCYCNTSFLATVAYASLCYSCLLAQYQHK